MIYNRDWLKNEIQSYLHDDSVTATLDTWIDMGALWVSQNLRCYEMEAEVTRNAPDEFLQLTARHRHLISVQWLKNGMIWVPLKTLAKHEAQYYKRSGNPGGYYIEDRKVYPAPFVDGEYKARVLENVVIPDDGQTEVAALTAYPFLFLNAALAEAYDWKQNEPLSARYERKAASQAEQVTADYLADRVGETPAQRAI